MKSSEGGPVDQLTQVNLEKGSQSRGGGYRLIQLITTAIDTFFSDNHLEC